MRCEEVALSFISMGVEVWTSIFCRIHEVVTPSRLQSKYTQKRRGEHIHCASSPLLLSGEGSWIEIVSSFVCSGSEDRSMSGAKAATGHTRSPSQQRILWSRCYNKTCLDQHLTGRACSNAQQSKLAPQRSPSTTIYSIQLSALFPLF